MDKTHCITLKNAKACFHPALFQLVITHETDDHTPVNERIDLGFAGTRLLEKLLESPGSVVSREALIEYAWSGRVVGQGSLNQQIYTLRQILQDEKEREIIQTLPRRGYLINPSFVQTAGGKPEAVAASEPAENNPIVATPQAQAEPAEEAPVTEPVQLAAKELAPTDNASTPAPPWLERLMLTVKKRAAWVSVMCFASASAFAASYQWLDTDGKGPVRRVVGQLQVFYPVKDQAMEIKQLQKYSDPLVKRLSELSSKPAKVVVVAHGDLLNMICIDPHYRVDSAHIPLSELTSANDEALGGCGRLLR